MHRLTNRNAEDRTADCSICGPGVRMKYHPRGWRCMTAVKRTEVARRKRRPAGQRASVQAWKKRNPDKVRAQKKRAKYGITRERLDTLLQAGCAICGASTSADGTALHIDHDHSCCPGKTSCGSCVRGALCRGCNMGLGSFRDDVGNMSRAIEYILSHRSEVPSEQALTH